MTSDSTSEVTTNIVILPSSVKDDHLFKLQGHHFKAVKAAASIQPPRPFEAAASILPPRLFKGAVVLDPTSKWGE